MPGGDHARPLGDSSFSIPFGRSCLRSDMLKLCSSWHLSSRFSLAVELHGVALGRLRKQVCVWARLFPFSYPRPEFKSPHTACWRGYEAEWEVEGDALYLVGLGGWVGGDGYRHLPTNIRKVGLEDPFPCEPSLRRALLFCAAATGPVTPFRDAAGWHGRHTKD